MATFVMTAEEKEAVDLLRGQTLRDFLEQKKLNTITIEVAAWGGKRVEIRELTAMERMTIGNMILKTGREKEGELDMAQMGRMLLTAATLGLSLPLSYAAILDNHGAAVQEIAQAVLALSGMNDLNKGKKSEG